jgi:hypothetical protein
MMIYCGGALTTIPSRPANTPAYSHAYKYIAFDGLRRLATGQRTAANPLSVWGAPGSK